MNRTITIAAGQNHLDMKTLFIIVVATAVAVCCISWLAYLFLRKKKDVLNVCLRIAGFWCCVDLLLAFAFFYMLSSDIYYFRHPTKLYIVQCLFTESFIVGAAIGCFGMNYNSRHEKTEQDA